MTRPYNVLFLCTGNSARSIMAEVILRRWGGDRFQAFSAGSHPRGAIHPATLEILKRLHHSTEGLRSKNWNEFARVRTARRWISSSRSATGPRERSVRSGRANR